MNVLKPILINLFIENSFACVEGRGPHKASLKCSEYVRKYKYCLKCDCKKFYPSINQQILSDMFHGIINDKRFMELLDDIIFSFEGGHNCPIGNYCSQWFGNFYLTALDNFVLHQLKCGAYIRYCDDFLLFSNDKDYLNYCYRKIECFLFESLDLSLSKNSLFNTKQGVDFCGYRSFGKYVLLRKSTATRIKRRFREIINQLENDNPDYVKIRSQIASANGQLKHCCGHHLRKALQIDELNSKIGGLINERQ